MDLYDGVHVVGTGTTDASGMVTFHVAGLGAGNHTISAVFTPDVPADFGGSQQSVGLTVNAAQLPPTGATSGSTSALAAGLLLLGAALVRVSARRARPAEQVGSSLRVW